MVIEIPNGEEFPITAFQEERIELLAALNWHDLTCQATLEMNWRKSKTFMAWLHLTFVSESVRCKYSEFYPVKIESGRFGQWTEEYEKTYSWTCTPGELLDLIEL